VRPLELKGGTFASPARTSVTGPSKRVRRMSARSGSSSDVWPRWCEPLYRCSLPAPIIAISLGQMSKMLGSVSDGNSFTLTQERLNPVSPAVLHGANVPKSSPPLPTTLLMPS